MAKLVKVTTAVGKGENAYEYEIEHLKFDSLEDYYASLPEDKNGPQAAIDIINAQNEQGAKQGKKEDVRKALVDGKDPKEPVKAHQTWAKTYVISGSTGGRVGGVTKTAAGAVGKALLEADPEKLKAIAAELGVDL